jgi:hypothetical protein
MPGYDLYDFADGFAMNKEFGSVFRISKKTGKPYRIKDVEYHKFPHLKEAMEAKWQEFGLDKKFPTEKHVIERRVLSDRTDDRTDEQYDLANDMAELDLQGSGSRQSSKKTRAKLGHKPAQRTKTKTLSQPELGEFEPETWLSHVAKHRHKTELEKVSKPLDPLDEQYAQCDCRRDCEAPQVPRTLAQTATVYHNASSRTRATEPEILDAALAEETSRSLKAVLSCRRWRHWLRCSGSGDSGCGDFEPNGRESSEPSSDQASQVSVAELSPVLLKWKSSRRPGITDIYSDEKLVGSVSFDLKGRVTVLVNDPEIAKHLKQSLSQEGFRDVSVKKARKQTSELEFLAKTVLNGLDYPSKPRDLLNLPEFVEAVSESDRAKSAQLRYLL